MTKEGELRFDIWFPHTCEPTYTCMYTHIHIYRDRERASVGMFLIIKQVWKSLETNDFTHNPC